MEDNLSESFWFRFEEMRDATFFAQSPRVPEHSFHPYASPSFRQRSLFELELSERSFTSELQYLGYFPPASELFDQVQFSPESVEDVESEIVPSLSVVEVNENQSVASLSSLPRQESMATFDRVATSDESLNSASPKPNTSFTPDSSPDLPQPSYRSAKISIGHFNSINMKVADSQELRKRLGSASKSPSKYCNCQKSKCLKLYCECFASRGYCQGCSCVDCHNLKEFEAERANVWEKAIERNPFRIKRRLIESNEGEKTCCKCERSGCSKNYCECFKKGMKCGSECNCFKCGNRTALRFISYLSYDEYPQAFKEDGV
eukprot:TRINITY_DN2343_c0_g1_i3.p1 TRINITY_DN2343_c0_g1~~TRINITY_DN2343_c0_g1_i3.p1  ORF type:complete len:318 (-),score=69.69 TRINITY_DN2343_c0_g1_i3:72-1025(-)